ncbi:flagellar hook-basal body complex protein FliE [Timonella sp. A28]|uniref:flagellar hook-basal body complex protein FliE n=1 Tax=Timonella sp. A28 TaxID=3442640 RepID=UPI003EBD331F
MPIPGIEGIGGVGAGTGASALTYMNSLATQARGTAGVSPSGYLNATQNAATATSGAAFSDSLVGAVNNIQNLQRKSSDLAVKAVTGELNDIHDYTIAATEAKVTLELTAALRNKAVDAFTEIMRMQA